jgi:hypothetical protein
MADLSGNRGGLIPAYDPANQLNACFRQNVSGKSLVTWIAVTHLPFLKPSLVAVRKPAENQMDPRSARPRIWSPTWFVDAAPSPCRGIQSSRQRSEKPRTWR